MTIVYALVARGSVILAEFSDANTNGGVIARQIVEKIKADNNDVNVSYSQNKYVFHVKRVDGLTCLCMADDLDARSKIELNHVYILNMYFYLITYTIWTMLRNYIVCRRFPLLFLKTSSEIREDFAKPILSAQAMA
ncbi:synaptobrevin, Longin-like domain protein [Artemisia annua]|uniref:Synaptobrevin, Longin-like domain protein n=1 Tax=Artemisia annua TaxID=35608 RepID=A0A2U1KN97_ARTAN|nr:synaptobrevin, Longin-like domain protein [Artemisia annua]